MENNEKEIRQFTLEEQLDLFNITEEEHKIISDVKDEREVCDTRRQKLALRKERENCYRDVLKKIQDKCTFTCNRFEEEVKKASNDDCAKNFLGTPQHLRFDYVKENNIPFELLLSNATNFVMSILAQQVSFEIYNSEVGG